MATSWQVVTKKQTNKIKKSGLVNGKELLLNPPRLEDIVGISEKKSLFDVLDDGKLEKPPPPSQVSEPKKPRKTENIQKKQSLRQNKTPVKIRNQPITVEDVEKLHDINEVKFQGVSSLFLKELAKTINNSLVSSDEYRFTAKSFDYPTCLLNNKVVKHIKDILRNMSKHTFIAVFNDFLEAMPKDMLKGYSVTGYRIILQLIATHHSKVAVANLSASSALCMSYINRPAICSNLLWAFGQGGFKDVSVGLTVWLKVMLPISQQKKYSSLVVNYLKELLIRHSTSKSLSSELYFTFLDETILHWSKLEHKSGSLKPLFTQLKDLLCNSYPNNALHTLLEPLLNRISATITSGIDLEVEIAEFAVHCLCKDKQTFSLWREHYSSKLAESAVILSYIDNNWDHLKAILSTRELSSIVKTFELTNEKLQISKQKTEHLNECKQLCHKLQLKLSKTQSRKWIWILVLASITVICFIGSDKFPHIPIRKLYNILNVQELNSKDRWRSFSDTLKEIFSFLGLGSEDSNLSKLFSYETWHKWYLMLIDNSSTILNVLNMSSIEHYLLYIQNVLSNSIDAVINNLSKD